MNINEFKKPHYTLRRNVIPNLSKGYIHLYSTSPPIFASYIKCIGKFFIESKKEGGNIISNLHIVSIMFLSSCFICCECNLFEQTSLKK